LTVEIVVLKHIIDSD